MQTRTYTEKSNARRAAKAAGVDPGLVFATDDGFTFPTPEEEPGPGTNGHDQTGNGVDAGASAEQMKAAHAEDDRDVEIAKDRLHEIEANPESLTFMGGANLQNRLDRIDSPAPKGDEDIPAFCKIAAADRKASWACNPPKAAPAPIKEETMPKTAKAKSGAKQPKGAKGANKTEMLLTMLKKGATVDALCKATVWLPHTLRARICRLAKPKKDGGLGLKIERERVDGVTSYRVVS